MRALVYQAPGCLTVEDVPRPRLSAGDQEIAVDAAGICGADISGFLGRSRHRTPPLILGHELVGRTPDGRRVVVDPVIGCGQCAHCRGGRKNLCASLRLLGMDPLDGCFAEFVAVPGAQAYEIPDTLAMRRRSSPSRLPISFTCSGWPRRSREFRMGIVGAGTMGSLALKMALHLGLREVLVEDVEEARLAGARRMGATWR